MLKAIYAIESMGRAFCLEGYRSTQKSFTLYCFFSNDMNNFTNMNLFYTERLKNRSLSKSATVQKRLKKLSNFYCI